MNEFKPHSASDTEKKGDGFYNLLPAETKVRDLASVHSNSYWVTIFACCRELEKKHWTGLANPDFSPQSKTKGDSTLKPKAQSEFLLIPKADSPSTKNIMVKVETVEPAQDKDESSRAFEIKMKRYQSELKV